MMPTSPTTYSQRLRAKWGDTASTSNPRLRAARKLRDSARYQKFRKWFRNRHPICETCKAAGKWVPMAHCHHIRGLADYPGDLCDESRCQALCARCHARADSVKARVTAHPATSSETPL